MNTLRLFACTMALSFLIGTTAHSSGIFSQIILPFNSKRVFAYKYNKAEHSLVIEIKNTPPSELEALEQYDERLVRRVLMKDMGPVGTEVKLILRDRNVRAHVTSFTEPFRIAIDIFDAGYEEKRDPKTGLPITQVETPNEQASFGTPDGEFKLLQPTEGNEMAQPYPASGMTPTPVNNKRRLLQPTPQLFTEPNQMNEAMANVQQGIGQAWSTYPPYIYRIQTAYFEGSSKERWTKEDRVKAISSAKAMADFAGKLFNFGNENQAYIAYQQVLHKDPSVFDKDALHLFKFAEIQFGQGNLTLARGYYNEVIAKHPESPLANYSKLRSLDIQAIRHLRQDSYKNLPELTKPLATLKTGNNGEFNALVAIREAHWGKEGQTASYSSEHIPKVSESTYNKLSDSYATVKSKRTKFHLSNLVLNQMLEPEAQWSKATGDFAANYFDRFDTQSAEPWRTDLRKKLYSKLNASLREKVANGQLVAAIQDYESLPRSLRSIQNAPKTAWALAEAYRKLGQTGKAINLYDSAQKNTKKGPDRFKAQFWLAVTAREKAQELKAGGGSQNQIQRLTSTSSKADAAMLGTWNALKEKEQEQFSTAYKVPLEKTVTDDLKLKTSAKIVLSNWTKGLTTKASTDSGGELTDWERHFSPSGSAVFLLRDLARRFSELGMTKERRETLKLLKFMKPSQFSDDIKAKQLWSNELVALAEDYRKANQNLDAGRIYALVGQESQNWEGRAEALYKGGLLLYKAGRREEAVASFTKASNDGNNLFYANLARERLGQIQ